MLDTIFIVHRFNPSSVGKFRQFGKRLGRCTMYLKIPAVLLLVVKACAYRISKKLTMVHVDMVAVAPDAPKIGKLAEELLIGPIKHRRRGNLQCGVALPQ